MTDSSVHHAFAEAARAIMKHYDTKMSCVVCGRVAEDLAVWQLNGYSDVIAIFYCAGAHHGENIPMLYQTRVVKNAKAKVLIPKNLKHHHIEDDA